MMNALFVVAHPDDEVLGGGATIARMTEKGIGVHVAVLNTFDVTAYDQKEEHQELLRQSQSVLDITSSYFGEYDDSQMNNANHREMVEFIEKVMLATQPDVVFTHHPADVNEDHRWVFQSVIEAFRIGQRQRYDIPPIRELLLMEVLSSTDWGVDTSRNPFRANTFFPVNRTHIQKKIDALKMYNGVLRDVPHPRREDTIESLAKLRGAQGGFEYAEAFECVFRRMI